MVALAGLWDGLSHHVEQRQPRCSGESDVPKRLRLSASRLADPWVVLAVNLDKDLTGYRQFNQFRYPCVLEQGSTVLSLASKLLRLVNDDGVVKDGELLYWPNF